MQRTVAAVCDRRFDRHRPPLQLPDRRAVASPVWFLQEFFRFILRSIGVVTGVYSLLILSNRTVRLAANVEDLGAVDVSPDFDPFRLQVTVQRFLEHARSGLEVPEFKQGLTHTE